MRSYFVLLLLTQEQRLPYPLYIMIGCPTGLLEFVSDAETLRAIQTQHGVTGSFRDKPLAEWLTRHNPTDSAYTQVSLS